MTGWTPIETWSFIVGVLLMVALLAWSFAVARQDRRDRPSRLAPMTPDEAHMADLRRLQNELRADYGVPDPTPVDDNGRVRKRGVDFDGGDAA